MKLLVTGGAGYIGSVVTSLLLDAGHQVTVLDDLSTGHQDAIPAGAGFVRARVHDAAEVLDPTYEAVLHFAAKSLVGESVARPELYWENNVVGSLALLDAMRGHGVRRLVFSSTAATYGEPATMPITEDTPPRPTNPYGMTKLTIDMAIAAECAAHGLGAFSLRYFNVAGAHLGAGADLGERHDPETHLIPNLLKVASGVSPEAKLFGSDYPTRDGTCVRDYIHVTDLADAHVRALKRTRADIHDICNLGSGEGFTVREVLDAVRQVTGHPVPAADHPRRPGDPPTLIASNARARELLSWAPTRDITQMAADAWKFTQNH
ncbi:UDP-glucose 4-epimerase GalE [Sporichthya sp.]|uniref:UDP-glucose 4-epimerase GalE n=1 Tax=Sporichthya sp. TaxID=65475 RepID=UPI0017A49FF6|nr:UDP-glucose 4-epimerase GalE [Sporichthya sp.]MBA3745448.1 UDP-glucose 4-epimerase GalE [Sporichthya sp.]